MSIKQKPIGIKEYYQNVRDTYIIEREKALLDIDRLVDTNKDKRREIIDNLTIYKIPLVDYPEFQQDKYINGRLIAVASVLYSDKKLDLDYKSYIFKLLLYAKNQQQIYKLNKRVEKLNKILDLTYKDYTTLLRTFYTAIQKELVINGYGYKLEGRLGWICYNRILNNKFGKRVIDYKATRERKKEILEAGGTLWNKDDAKWCEDNDIHYEGEDYRVFLKSDATYELAICGCTIQNGSAVRIKSADYREAKIRGKSNDDIRLECNNNLNKICEVGIDIGTKLHICLAADKLLYTKFIRNENQTSMHFRKINRKNR